MTAGVITFLADNPSDLAGERRGQNHLLTKTMLELGIPTVGITRTDGVLGKVLDTTAAAECLGERGLALAHLANAGGLLQEVAAPAVQAGTWVVWEGGPLRGLQFADAIGKADTVRALIPAVTQTVVCLLSGGWLSTTLKRFTGFDGVTVVPVPVRPDPHFTLLDVVAALRSANADFDAAIDAATQKGRGADSILPWDAVLAVIRHGTTYPRR